MAQKDEIARVFERHLSRYGYAKTTLDEVAREMHILMRARAPPTRGTLPRRSRLHAKRRLVAGCHRDSSETP